MAPIRRRHFAPLTYTKPGRNYPPPPHLQYVGGFSGAGEGETKVAPRRFFTTAKRNRPVATSPALLFQRVLGARETKDIPASTQAFYCSPANWPGTRRFRQARREKNCLLSCSLPCSLFPPSLCQVSVFVGYRSAAEFEFIIFLRTYEKLIKKKSDQLDFFPGALNFRDEYSCS